MNTIVRKLYAATIKKFKKSYSKMTFYDSKSDIVRILRHLDECRTMSEDFLPQKYKYIFSSSNFEIEKIFYINRK